MENMVEHMMLPKELNNKILAGDYKFIITGASGWLGRFLLEILYSCFGQKLADNVFAISNSTSKITLNSGDQIPAYQYDHKFFDKHKYILCHFAFLTRDKILTMSDGEYIRQNQAIRDNVAKIINYTNPVSMLYSSSGALYNKDDLYGRLKLEDEIYFKELSAQMGYKIIIPRIFNLAGPYINKHNLYAISDFIIQLVKNNQISINANFPVIRSYIHILDLFKICLNFILDEHKNCLTFDTSNQKEIELSELATTIINLINPGGAIIRPSYNIDLPANRYAGNIQIQQELCQKYGIILSDYQSMILDTFHYLKNHSNELR
jgi:nucleoside-diphosphate-sugar epimerase